jgi:hypothetical protein
VIVGSCVARYTNTIDASLPAFTHTDFYIYRIVFNTHLNRNSMKHQISIIGIQRINIALLRVEP